MACNRCGYWCGGDSPFGECGYHNQDVPRMSTCPADTSVAVEATATVEATEEKETTAQSQVRKRRRTADLVYVLHDETRPDMELYAHQKTVFERYKDEEVIPLFMCMGTGKTLTTLKIAEYKYRKGEIDGLLVIAPNDVHKQWYDDLVNGVEVKHDGVMWQELSVNLQAQCLGGRGGQPELYDFDDDGSFKFVCVNVDTFSTPKKWQQVTDWANSGRYMIAIDEATVIKNPDSKRSQRLLYEFNNNVWGRRNARFPLGTQKRFPVRAVLTGTPTTNGPVDLWAIMEFVQPNYFGRNYYSFRNYFGMFTQIQVHDGSGHERNVQVFLTENTWRGIKFSESYEEAFRLFGCSEDTYMTVKHQDRFVGPYKHADELKALLDRSATFIRLVDCVDMPKVNYIVRRVGMTPEQAGCYESVTKKLMAKFGDKITLVKNQLVLSVRQQQISSGFIVAHEDLSDEALAERMFDEEYDATMDLNPDEVVWLNETNPKLEQLMRDVESSDRPVLVVTRYSAEAAKIYEMLSGTYRTGIFTGWKETPDAIGKFKDGELDVLVANGYKISRGHNLQRSHVILFYSNSFSMETRQQTEFRTFRLGQEHPCDYVDYSCAPIDDTVMRSLKMKKSLLDYLQTKGR